MRALYIDRPLPMIEFLAFGALDRVNEAIFITDEDARFIYANKFASTYLGYSNEEILRFSISDIDINFPAIADIKGKWNEIISGFIDRFDTVHKCKNGELIAVEVSPVFTFHDGAPFCLTFIRDINARIQKEEAEKRLAIETANSKIYEILNTKLRASEAKYRQLFSEMLSAFALCEISCDADNNPIDYRILEVNPAFERFTGLKAKDVVGKTMLQLFPRTESYWMQRYGEVALTGEHTQFTEYFLELDKYCEVSAYSPEKNLFAVVFRDVTRRIRAEQDLQLSEERLKLSTGSANIGIWDWNIVQNELVWDDAMFVMYGAKREDFSGALEAWQSCIYKDDVDSAFKVLQETLAGTRHYDTEFRIMHPDGTTHYIKADATTLRDSKGKAVRMIGVNIDITKEKEAEAILIGFNKRLEQEVAIGIEDGRQKDAILFQQSKLAAMGEMIGAIAHQWRQPLTAISSSVIGLELKQSLGSLSDEELSAGFENIEQQTHKMSTIISDFLNFFRPTKEKSEFSLKSVLDSILALLGTQLSNRSIAVHHDTSECKLLGFKNELEQVFINIMLNAKDAFETSTVSEKHINIYVTEYKWKVDLVFEDNAGGIPEKILERVFEPYFTTKDEGKGTGIGLYMGKMIIEKSFDGSIVAENIHDETSGERIGARFIIALPKVNANNDE